MGWSSLYHQICKEINAKPRIVTTIRDPVSRLYSHLRHNAYYCESLDQLVSQIEDQNSEFENCIYRYVNDTRIKEYKSLDSDEYLDNAKVPLNQIDFIDIADSTSKSKIKSEYLSNSDLPNIIQMSQYNDSISRNKCNLSNAQIDYAFELCIRKGYLVKDQSINLDKLKQQTKSRLEFIDTSTKNECSIHPLTFIVYSDYTYKLIETSEFLKRPFEYF